jgi:hypothetical protein
MYVERIGPNDHCTGKSQREHTETRHRHAATIVCNAVAAAFTCLSEVK